MLDDIMEACAQRKPRYVLGQLVVVDTGETHGKVVDGQQRLTSLAVVLNALEEVKSGFLDFENRESSKKILDALDNPQSGDELDNLAKAHPACGKIRDIYLLALDYIGDNLVNSDDRVSKEDFRDYLKDCVFFAEKRLGEGERIQCASEALNTTGEPLKREDIAKAKLISDMAGLGLEREAELLNYAWKLCCSLESDLDGRVAERARGIHAEASLDALHGEMQNLARKDEDSGSASLARVVDAVKRGNVIQVGGSGGQGGAYATGDFAALLTPYRFLDTVLRAVPELGRFNSISAISKITREGDLAIATPDAAIRVIRALLLYRIALDRLVARRKKNNERNWELKAPIGDEGARRRLVLAESMMAVSGVEPSRKLIDAAKAAQDAALAKGDEPSPEEIIARLEEYAVKRIKEKNELATLDSGAGAAHFAFRWLDYLLALSPPEGIKDKAERFSFVEASSVEHLLPRHPLDGREYSPEEKAMLDTFGNLALISRSKNSKQSNLPPKEKARQEHGLESLKYELMLQIADREGWKPETCKAHGDAMKGILAGSLQPAAGSA